MKIRIDGVGRQQSATQQPTAVRNEVNDEVINSLITQIRTHTFTQTLSELLIPSFEPPPFQCICLNMYFKG